MLYYTDLITIKHNINNRAMRNNIELLKTDVRARLGQVERATQSKADTLAREECQCQADFNGVVYQYILIQIFVKYVTLFMHYKFFVVMHMCCVGAVIHYSISFKCMMTR